MSLSTCSHVLRVTWERPPKLAALKSTRFYLYTLENMELQQRQSYGDLLLSSLRTCDIILPYYGVFFLPCAWLSKVSMAGVVAAEDGRNAT